MKKKFVVNGSIIDVEVDENGKPIEPRYLTATPYPETPPDAVLELARQAKKDGRTKTGHVIAWKEYEDRTVIVFEDGPKITFQGEKSKAQLKAEAEVREDKAEEIALSDEELIAEAASNLESAKAQAKANKAKAEAEDKAIEAELKAANKSKRTASETESEAHEPKPKANR